MQYFSNIYVGKNNNNQYVFLFQYLKYGYNVDVNDASQLGKSYFPAIVIVWNKTNIKLLLCFESSENKTGIASNKKYVRSFVKEKICNALANYSMQCYKEVFSKKYSRRTAKGIELEILLHLYAYYFDIDKDDDYISSKEIDIDNHRDGLLIEALATSSMIKKCENALINKNENKSISRILKIFFSIRG